MAEYLPVISSVLSVVASLVVRDYLSDYVAIVANGNTYLAFATTEVASKAAEAFWTRHADRRLELIVEESGKPSVEALRAELKPLFPLLSGPRFYNHGITLAIRSIRNFVASVGGSEGEHYGLHQLFSFVE